MTEFTLPHERHSHHMSAVATGVTVTGPLGDGMVSFTFYRDAAKVLKQTYQAKEVEGPGGRAVELNEASAQPEVSYFREEVVTLLIPADKVHGFASVMQKLVENLAKIQQKEAGDQ